MKVYKDIQHISFPDYLETRFLYSLNDIIESMQNNGLEVEVQYSTSTLKEKYFTLSALILGYTEE